MATTFVVTDPASLEAVVAELVGAAVEVDPVVALARHFRPPAVEQLAVEPAPAASVDPLALSPPTPAVVERASPLKR